MYPFCQGHSCTTTCCYAKGIKASTNKEVRQFWRLAYNKVAIWRKAFRTVGQCFDTNIFKSWNTTQGQFHQLFKVIVIAVQQRVVKTLGNTCDCPGDGI